MLKRGWVKLIQLKYFVLLFLLVIFPLVISNRYYINVATLAGMYIVLALGLNITVGFAGLLDLGYIAFYAIGAYTSAILTSQFQFSFWLVLPLGAIGAAILGLFIGSFTLRLRGDYLAIVTLGFGQIVKIVANNWDGLTNGPKGILGIPPPRVGSFVFKDEIHFYYLILLIGTLVVLLVSRLNNSRIGRAWIAIREDEIAASCMGINVTLMKLLAFSLGAILSGLIGVFFANRMGFVSPESFTFFESVIILCMVVLGGMGSIPGVILGAVVLILLPEFLRGLENYQMLIFGGSMVLMMVFRPQGLLGSWRKKMELHPETRRIKEEEDESIYDLEKTYE